MSTATLLPRTLLLAALAFSASSCQHAADPMPTIPTTYDALAEEPGYWEWEQTHWFRGTSDPATTGVSRQLTFAADGTLTLYQDKRLVLQQPYQRTAAPLIACNLSRQIDFLVLTAAVPELNVDSSLRTQLNQGVTNGGIRRLSLGGERMCQDIGSIVTYRWVSTP